LASELGVEPKTVHIPSEIMPYTIRNGSKFIGRQIATALIFDNSKIKKFVPEFCAKTLLVPKRQKIVQWFRENTLFKGPDVLWRNWMNRLIEDWQGFKSFRKH
jgi:hypothetical protein